MAIKVTEKVKQAFIAMPHVEEMYLTGDGNFHLHAFKGGKLVKREDVDLDPNAKPAPIISDADKAIIAEINKCATLEEVDQFTVVGASDVVLKAGEEKKATLVNAKPKK